MTIEIETPRGWAICTIDTVVALDGVFTDGDWVESKDQDPNGDVRLIQLADIGDGEFRNKSARFLTKSKAYDLNCTFLSEGDLLVARMPDPLGRCCIFPLAGDEKYVTVVDVCAIRLGSSPINHKYIMYLVNSPEIRAAIAALQSGSTRKRISRKNLATIELPIAPINEQHRIVAKIEELFSELDKGIESLKTAREQLKVYRQAVLKHAFDGKLTAQWREENKDKLETADQLLTRIQIEREASHQRQLEEWKSSVKAWESDGKSGKKPPKPRITKELPWFTSGELDELPKLPGGWAWVKIDKICDHEQSAIKAGPFGSALKKAFYTPQGYKIYGQEQVISGNPSYGDYYVSKKKYLELAACRVKPFDVLISLVGTVGKVLILPEGVEEGIINPRLIKISPNISAYDPKFFKYYFESAFVRGLYKTRTHGATMDVMNMSILQSLPFPLCSIEEQKLMVSEIETIDTEIENMEKTISSQSNLSSALRQSILKSAFSGQFVEQDSNDEPASVLLERIKAEKAKQTKPGKKKKRKTAA